MENSLNQRWLDLNRAWVQILIGLSFTLGLASTAEAGTLKCNPAATSLETLISCIVAHMPGKLSEGFVVPDANTQDDWRGVVSEMLGNYCDDMAGPNIILPLSLSPFYSISSFSDAGKQYCVLMETATNDVGNNVGKVSKGWGTVITNRSAKRELSIQVPHPIADIDTAAEGIGIFRDTEARSFIMAGTHRKANSALSACEPQVKGEDGEFLTESDAGHNVATLYQPAVQALPEFYDPLGVDFVAIQFHGMGSSCPGVDVYMTYGLNLSPVSGDRLLTLKSNLKTIHPGWVVTVPGDLPVCSLNGSFNVQGRLLNQAPGPVCTTAATSYTGRFIHIEQKPNFRIAGDWISTINDTWPAPVNLAVSKVGSPSSVTIGGAVAYGITVTNNGPFDATGVTLTDTLPPGLVFASSPDPDCSQSGAAVACLIGDLALGAIATRTIVVSAKVPAPLVNTACASAAEGVAIVGRCDSWTTVVELPAQFSIMMLDLESLVERGQLRAGPGDALMATLRAATRQLERGHPGPAVRELTAFINHVEALQRNRQLDAESAAALVAQAEGAIAQIQGGPR
jgi:uncharacterized repeat protein (TIGR01451 family)